MGCDNPEHDKLEDELEKLLDEVEDLEKENEKLRNKGIRRFQILTSTF